MPRLTTLNYFRQRAALQHEWLDRGAYAFVVLSPTEQIDIHAYFEPTKHLSPIEAVEHRRIVTAQNPSLPQRAGRAFARIKPFLDMPPPVEATSQSPSLSRRPDRASAPRAVRVFSQVTPDLDPEEIVRIILRLAEEGPPPNLTLPADES